MRRLIVIAVVLMALIAALAVAVPRFLVWEDYRAELTARAEAMTGRTVTIRGRIDLDLLPQPRLSLAGTTLASGPDAAERMRLEVDRLDLELKPLPLLAGRLDVAGVRLVRPVLHLEPPAAGRLELPQLVGALAWLPLGPDGPRRIAVVDGRAILSALVPGGVAEIDEVDLELAADGPGGAVVLEGGFALDGQALQVGARLGRPTEDAWSTLRLDLSASPEDEGAATTLSFGGVVGWRSGAPQLRGELALEGQDVRSAIGWLGQALGRHMVPMPAALAAPFQLSGPLELADHRLSLPDFAFALDGVDLGGRLSLTLAAQPELDLALDAAKLGLPAAAVAIDGAGLAPLRALAALVRGRIDLSIAALGYRGDAIRRLRVTLRLDGDGTVAVADARAVLPGQTDVGFTGELAGSGGNPELRGRLKAVTENLRGALAWLDLAPGEVAEGRLRSLSFDGRVAVAAGAWKFSDLELRVDASRATGSVVVAPGARPRVAARLALDRLDLDAYWPGEDPAAVLARLARPLARFDAAIEAQLARLTWGGAQLLEVGLAGRAVDGRLSVEKLTVGDLAEAQARVTGEVDLGDGTFDLAAELRHAQAARVLRRLGFAPPPLLARLQPLAATALARGSIEAAQVELELQDGSGKVTLAGEVGWRGPQPHYRLALQAEHPDYQGLLGELGAPAPAGPAAPLAIAGNLEHDGAGEALIAGTARLGPTSFTGRIGWQDGGARPRVTARLSVGEPTASVLAALLDLSGLRLEWPRVAGGVKGRWSERPLALDLLDRFDGELTLFSKGGLAGPGFELIARFEQGTLALDHVAMALWGGRLEGRLALDVRRPLPYLTAALDLQDADLAALAAWLGVAPVLAGPADLRLEATGAGSSVRALVGSLIGEVEITGHDGAVLEDLPARLVGAPAPLTALPQETTAELADLAATLPLQRGVVILPPTEIQIDGVAARLEGQIDLYLWATDLTLRPDAAGAALRVVGPLDRPQVRLDRPPAPGANAPDASLPDPAD